MFAGRLWVHAIWLVSFMNYDLGYIDLEEKTLQALQKPFWPKGVNYVFGTFCKGSLRTVSLKEWRRGWDLNPRYGFPYARFRGECFQPLSHLSAVGKARLADELADRQRCVMLRVSIGNPSSLEKHFMRNLARRTILVGDSEILQSRTVEDRTQFRDSSHILRLQYARLAHPDPLLHHFHAGGESANDSFCS